MVENMMHSNRVHFFLFDYQALRKKIRKKKKINLLCIGKPSIFVV